MDDNNNFPSDDELIFDDESLIGVGSLDTSNIKDKSNTNIDDDHSFLNLDEYCIKKVCPTQKNKENSSIFTHPFLILIYIIIGLITIYILLEKVNILKAFSIKLKPSVFILESLKVIGVLISLYLSIKGLQASTTCRIKQQLNAEI
jgi:hypothetical protein